MGRATENEKLVIWVQIAPGGWTRRGSVRECDEDRGWSGQWSEKIGEMEKDMKKWAQAEHLLVEKVHEGRALEAASQREACEELMRREAAARKESRRLEAVARAADEQCAAARAELDKSHDEHR